VVGVVGMLLDVFGGEAQGEPLEGPG
jgi:hypothetical protein